MDKAALWKNQTNKQAKKQTNKNCVFVCYYFIHSPMDCGAAVGDKGVHIKYGNLMRKNLSLI